MLLDGVSLNKQGGDYIFNLTQNCTLTAALSYSSESGGTCGEGVIWEVADGGRLLIISGEGEMAFEGPQAPWIADYYSTIEEVIIGPEVQNIADGAFEGCESIKEVTIPETLKAVPDRAFKNCEDLETLTFASDVESIGESAFEGSNIKNEATEGELVLSDGLKTVGKRAFAECEGIGSVAFPNELQSIGDEAFTLGYVGEVSVPERYNSCTLMTVTSDNSNLPLVPAVSVTAGN